MGMYDSIKTNVLLPFTPEMVDVGLDKLELDFQTKDLDCSMSEFFIQDNKLFERRYKIEEWVDDGSKFGGVLRRENPYLVDLKYHGIIRFYDWISNVQDKWDCWVEYQATFSNGILEKIELLKFEKNDNSDRKAREKELFDKIKKDRELWYNKYFFHTKLYRLFAFNIWYKSCSKLSNFFSVLSHKL